MAQARGVRCCPVDHTITGSVMSEHKPTPPGTRGYPEPQPQRNDKRDMPDRHTPHEHQNNPERKPNPSGR
jgi:hypothetical protein